MPDDTCFIMKHVSPTLQLTACSFALNRILISHSVQLTDKTFQKWQTEIITHVNSSSLTLGRRVTVVVLSFILSTALQRAALTSSYQLRYEQAKHIDGLQSDLWILLKRFYSRVLFWTKHP